MAMPFLPAARPGAIVPSAGSTGLEHCQPPRLGCCPPTLRAAIEQRIERLIELLDRIDGDPDYELLGDETDASGDELDQAFPEWRSEELIAEMGGRGLEPESESFFDPFTGILGSRLEDTELDDFREQEEPSFGRYGADQSRPFASDNPPWA